MNEDTPLRDCMIEILGDGAVPRDLLVERLLQRGLLRGSPVAARAIVDAALQMDTAFSDVDDDAVVYMPALLNGTTWTTWVDAGDAAQGFVRSHPNLSVMSWWLIGDDVPLVDAGGEVLGIVDTDGLMLDGRDTDVIIGPTGWLDGLHDRWASVAVVNGGLRWSSCDAPPEPTPRQLAAVRAGFEHARRSDRADEVLGLTPPPDPSYCVGEALVHAALVADRAAFVEAPVPPVAALFASADLVEDGGLVAQPGFDWEALHRWQLSHMLRLRYGVSTEHVDDLVAALAAGAASAAPDAEIDAEIDAASAVRYATVLDDGAAAAAFWEDLLRRGTSPEAIGRFAEAVDAAAPGAGRYGTAWLRSRAADAAGNPVAAADSLLLLAMPECDHGPLLLDAAAFAADRGDAATAYRLLRQAGVPDRAPETDDEDFADAPDEAALLMTEVRRWAVNRPAPMARRNEPCPCGSGRKYKSCHLGHETHPLHDRSAWLYEKARRHLLSRYDDSILDLAEVMAGDESELVDEITDLPLVHDIALHEGGVFDDFLNARQALLPDDEALLATQWSLVDRGVFEVTRIGGESLQLRNIGTGEVITVVNVTPNRSTQVGSVMFGRPLPVGDTYRAFSGFIALPFQYVTPMTDAVATGGAAEISEVLAAMFARPRVVDADGEELEWPDLDSDEPLSEPLPQDDPQVRAILAQHIAQYEARWLDESIPALGGRTPRDAVMDPVGREDVIRLLASLPVPNDDEVGAMDPRRLRAALGL